jgi:hypothetical protein
MTSLIDRYLRSVKEQLPRAKRDDIIAELSENLRAQMDDEAEARGRPLLDAEQAAILKRVGNPIVVAARYRGDSRSVSFGRQLIGPELFPTYAKVLTINIAITLVVVAVVLLIGGGVAFSAMYGGLVPIIVQFVIVTGIFIVANGRFARDPDGWDPTTLGLIDPDLDVRTLDGISTHLIGAARSKTVPYSTSLLDLAVTAVALAVLLSIGLPDSSGPMTAGPGWLNLYLPVNAVFALALIGPIVTLVRPTWTRFRVAARALFDAAFLVLLLLSFALGNWVVVTDVATASPELVRIVGLINTAIRLSIVVAIALTTVSLFLEVRRLRQMPR